MGNPIVLKNLSKRFSSLNNPRESRLVVNQINLKLKEGELLTLVGYKGSGKSTILRMIAGFEHPTEGEIYVDGQMVDGIPPDVRNVGYLVPENRLFEHMTVADNISSGFNIRHIPNKDRLRRFEQLVTIMGLNHVLDRSPAQLSQWQQRQVALARLLAPKPRVLLLDDPFVGLDPAASQQLRDATKLWQRELNIPMILATRDPVDALELGGRIAILNNGRFQQIDSPRKLVSSPANAFVADFLRNESKITDTPDDMLEEATSIIDGELELSNLAVNGNQREEDDQVESAIARNTFLGRPIRFEIDHEI